MNVAAAKIGKAIIVDASNTVDISELLLAYGI